MKGTTLLFTVCFVSVAALSAFLSPPIQKIPGKEIDTIIIDAGHGIFPDGKHDGTHGSFAYESDVCLAVAKKLVTILKEELPDVKILETRPTPAFVGLRERAEFANKNNGDLFVSIHANYAPPIRERVKTGTRLQTYYVKQGGKRVKKTRRVNTYRTNQYPNPANGTETFVFAAHKTEEKAEYILENGEAFQNETDDSTWVPDPNSPELIAQAALWTKKYFTNSVKLASYVEDEMKDLGRLSRGVKQRRVGIHVLQATAMPSILFETGFLSNKDEEKYLVSEDGQTELATALSKAIIKFKSQLEKTTSDTVAVSKYP